MLQTFLRRGCLLATLLLVWASAPKLCAAKPNVIYILADDLGYGDLGCYGQKVLRTPNLDRLAAEGMRFTQHYAGATVCAPSRCVLLTGLHLGHARIRVNGPVLLRDEDVTIADLLKDAGYRTGCFGKWGVGHPPPFDDPQRNGFDEFFGYANMIHAHNFYPTFVVKNGQRVPLRNVLTKKWRDRNEEDGRGVAEKKVDYVPDLVTAEALSFLQRNRSRPFFLYVALNVPHANNEAGNDGMEVPSHGEFASREWPEPEKGFAAMIHNIDRDVGLILARVKELGLDDKTLIFFSSDNGPHQEGGHRVSFFDSNGPLRGFKRDLYEGGIRVPLIARWPGKIPAASVSDHLSGFVDMLATLCDVSGVAAPPNDGFSMLPTLVGRTADQRSHDYLYWQFRDAEVRAVRRGKWKAVRLPRPRQERYDVELYDLSVDLSESMNVAQQFPDVTRELDALMTAAHTPLSEQ